MVIESNLFGAYRAPSTLEELEFQGNLETGAGVLMAPSGLQFPVERGIPNFVVASELQEEDRESLDWYRANASTYDEFLPLTFQTLRVDEGAEREKIIEELRLERNFRVLETGCGSGRDSLRISAELPDGELFLQDISAEILGFAVEKFRNIPTGPQIHFAVANGFSLPFPSDYFDRTFHFGGFNTFGDKPKALSEMARVTKPGGRVVVGDESIPDWLRKTEWGRILMNSNPHFSHRVPLEAVPQCAMNFSLRWIMGDAFYLMSFEKRDRDPQGNFDFEIPGWRGGTHRNRLYGQLEGVPLELKEAVIERARAQKTSVSAWLTKSLEDALDREV